MMVANRRRYYFIRTDKQYACPIQNNNAYISFVFH